MAVELVAGEQHANRLQGQVLASGQRPFAIRRSSEPLSIGSRDREQNFYMQTASVGKRPRASDAAARLKLNTQRADLIDYFDAERTSGEKSSVIS
jgi:hypothetical protein